MDYKVCPDCGALFPAGQRKHRSRRCPGDAPTWAADTRQRFFRNDETYGAQAASRTPGLKAQYREIVLTAPGVDAGLTWDRDRCRVKGPHKCSGEIGCVVTKAAADLWNRLSLRWAPKLHEAAQEATRRKVGCRANVVFKIPEVHKRGVRHWHMLFGYTSPRERAAVDVYYRELSARAPRYGFGYALPPVTRDAGTGAGAAYFASYFVNGHSGKGSITEAVQSPVLDGCSIYVSPKLTTCSGVTMRSLRLKRYLWWRIGPDGLRLAAYMGLGYTETYEIYEAGFWGKTLSNMVLDGEVKIE